MHFEILVEDTSGKIVLEAIMKKMSVSFLPMESIGTNRDLAPDIEKDIDEVFKGYNYLAENDVVIAKITPCFENGKGGIAKGLLNKAAFDTTELHILRARKNLATKFLYLFTISYLFRNIGIFEMRGVAGQQSVPENFKIPLPPLSEQKQIADFLDQETKRIDKLVEKTQQSIDLLKEYRASLITHAMTGQMDIVNRRRKYE